jgi:integrase
MPKVYAPGTRRNRSWVVRGWVDGKSYEITSKEARNARAALKAWDDFKSLVRQRDASVDTKRPKRFREVADAWKIGRNVSTNDKRYVAKLNDAWLEANGCKFGDLLVADVLPMHLEAAAAVAYPNAKPATVNRQVYVVAAAVLHYAAENKMRDYIVVRKRREPDPDPRRPAANVRDLLLGNTEGLQRVAVAMWFFQGWRVSESIRVRWEHTDLVEGTVQFWIPKRQKWKPVPIHPFVRAELAGLKCDKSAGPIFPWRHRHDVYDWLRPLCQRHKVRFTPHMGRHEFAGRLRELAATDRDIADAGSWTSAKSVARYNYAPPEHARSVIERLQTGGKTRGKRASG